MKTKHLRVGKGYDIRITAEKDVEEYTPLILWLHYSRIIPSRLRLQLVRQDKTPRLFNIFHCRTRR